MWLVHTVHLVKCSIIFELIIAVYVFLGKDSWVTLYLISPKWSRGYISRKRVDTNLLKAVNLLMTELYTQIFL